MRKEPFTSTPASYLRYTMLIWMATRGWLLFIPLVVVVIIAVANADARWAIVAVTYLLVCIPMILTPVVMSHILTPKARRQLSLKTVAVNPDKSIAITYYEHDDEQDKDLETDHELIPASEVKAIFHFRSWTVIWLKAPKIDIILIPDY